MVAILTGFIAGFIHVLSGPDHLAAIAPLAIEKKMSTWNIGFRWGIGHTSGVLIIGIFMITFRNLIPQSLLSTFGERLVGIMLIGIGVWGLRKVISSKIHLHEHTHNGIKHKHIHYHKENLIHNELSPHFHTHTALAVGILHGLAGSSHILGIIPALAFPTKLESISYLIFFGVGTITAMVIFSIVLGASSIFIESKGLKFYKGLMLSFSFAAIITGSVWILI
jgi:sulfite exporter TauE/SafE